MESQSRFMPHILIADDDPSIRKLLETVLLRDGFAVTSVSNGKLAFEHACRSMPDLIVLDCAMPIADGRSTARKLRADARTAHIPIVMLSSQSNREDQQTGIEAGANAYLTKPFHARTLVAQLSRYITAA